MDKLNEYVDTKTEFYDEWYQFSTVTFAKKLKRKDTLKMFISLENFVMKTIKAITIAHAME